MKGTVYIADSSNIYSTDKEEKLIAERKKDSAVYIYLPLRGRAWLQILYLGLFFHVFLIFKNYM